MDLIKTVITRRFLLLSSLLAIVAISVVPEMQSGGKKAGAFFGGLALGGLAGAALGNNGQTTVVYHNGYYGPYDYYDYGYPSPYWEPYDSSYYWDSFAHAWRRHNRIWRRHHPVIRHHYVY